MRAHATQQPDGPIKWYHKGKGREHPSTPVCCPIVTSVLGQQQRYISVGLGSAGPEVAEYLDGLDIFRD